MLGLGPILAINVILLYTILGPLVLFAIYILFDFLGKPPDLNRSKNIKTLKKKDPALWTIDEINSYINQK